jgi:enamine deaminase RidA (YjgF/YER057c/UK114 family)
MDRLAMARHGYPARRGLCEDRLMVRGQAWEIAMQRMTTIVRTGIVMSLLTLAGSASAAEDAIVRRSMGDFPISSSVLVPPGAKLVFVSGTLADAAKPDVPAGSIERLGDTETQAASIFGKIALELGASGLGLADVVKMNVFMVGDPSKGGAMDFAGLMKAYSRVFGVATQGKLPARTTVQVAALPVPGALVEIEVVAAR